MADVARNVDGYVVDIPFSFESHSKHTLTDFDRNDTPSACTSFSDIGLNAWLVNQCAAVGMDTPTPIQYHCVPKILKGRDCIGCAKTGSGKTAAFALPIIQKLCDDPYGIFGLVLAPTRELAFQIGEQFSVLGKPMGLKVCIVTGGRDMIQQGLELSKKPHIVIATPGRLADHIETGTNFSLKRIAFLVLDEADRLLEDKFGDQLKTIFSALPLKRQTLLFSATLTETLKEVNQLSHQKPYCWSSESPVATVDTLDQRYVLMPAHVKEPYLVHIVDTYREKHPNSSIMIFTQTCKMCQILATVFNEVGLECVAIHSVLLQRQRLAALAKFKSNQVKIIIATDVASRGLDIPTVDLIINHNVPTKPKDYIHRVGRTARAGRGGAAITLVTQFDVSLVRAVETLIGTKLVEHKVDEQAVARIAVEVGVAKREAEIRLDEEDFGERKEINRQKRLLLEENDAVKCKRQKCHQPLNAAAPPVAIKSTSSKKTLKRSSTHC